MSACCDWAIRAGRRSGSERRRCQTGAMATPSFLSSLTGLFAQPAAENPTVVMVEAAYRALGLDARYLTCEVPPEHLADAVRGAEGDGLAGVQLLAAAQGRRDRSPGRGRRVRPPDRRGELRRGPGRPTGRGEHRRAGLPDLTVPGRRAAGRAGRAAGRRRGRAGDRDRTGASRRIRDPHREPRRAAGTRARGPGRGGHAREGELRAVDGAGGVPNADVVVNATSIGLFPDIGARGRRRHAEHGHGRLRRHPQPAPDALRRSRRRPGLSAPSTDWGCWSTRE